MIKKKTDLGIKHQAASIFIERYMKNFHKKRMLNEFDNHISNFVPSNEDIAKINRCLEQIDGKLDIFNRVFNKNVLRDMNYILPCNIAEVIDSFNNFVSFMFEIILDYKNWKLKEIENEIKAKLEHPEHEEDEDEEEE